MKIDMTWRQWEFIRDSLTYRHNNSSGLRSSVYRDSIRATCTELVGKVDRELYGTNLGDILASALESDNIAKNVPVPTVDTERALIDAMSAYITALHKQRR